MLKTVLTKMGLYFGLVFYLMGVFWLMSYAPAQQATVAPEQPIKLPPAVITVATTEENGITYQVGTDQDVPYMNVISSPNSLTADCDANKHIVAKKVGDYCQMAIQVKIHASVCYIDTRLGENVMRCTWPNHNKKTEKQGDKK